MLIVVAYIPLRQCQFEPVVLVFELSLSRERRVGGGALVRSLLRAVLWLLALKREREKNGFSKITQRLDFSSLFLRRPIYLVI